MKAAARKAIPNKSFVYPPGTKTGGKTGAYPIDTPARARNALARSAQSGTKGSERTVRAAVSKKYPGIGKKGKK